MIGFDQIEFWYWWIAAVAFAAIEVFAPSAAFIWMAWRQLLSVSF